MGPNFQPRLRVLPASQRRLWDEFVGVPREFVLYGGTALALHLGHPTSVDFSVSVDRGGPVKISFFGLPALGRLTAPLIAADNGVQVASLLDLAGTKAAVVQQRAEAKDYLDIDVLLNDRRIDLPAALVCARAIHGSMFNPQLTLKALSFFGDGNLDRLPRDVQDRLARAAREVDLDRLPGIADLVRSFEKDFGTNP